MIEDFRDFLSALRDADVEFLVVGAHALAAHGVPRVTGDLDIWVAATPVNAQRIWRALGAFGAPLATLGIEPADFVRPDQVVQLGLPPHRLDILTSASGLTFAEAWATRLNGHLFEVPVAFLGRAALVQNKRATGRPRDLEDVRALEG